MTNKEEEVTESLKAIFEIIEACHSQMLFKTTSESAKANMCMKTVNDYVNSKLNEDEQKEVELLKNEKHKLRTERVKELGCDFPMIKLEEFSEKEFMEFKSTLIRSKR
jgi:hypothetical protein